MTSCFLLGTIKNIVNYFHVKQNPKYQHPLIETEIIC